MFDEELTFLKGVGPRRADVLKSSGIACCHDLLHFYPRRYLDRSTISPIRSLREDGVEATVVGTVRVQDWVRRRRDRFEVVIVDAAGGTLTLTWFNGLSWISNVFEIGDRVAFHGKVQRRGRKMLMVHPDFDKLDGHGPSLDTGRILALYRGSSAFQRMGLTSRLFRRVIYNLIKTRGLEIPEILPAWMIEEYGLMEGRIALRAIHFPRNKAELERARNRLKFEELFFLQVFLGLKRRLQREKAGNVVSDTGDSYRRFLNDVLPFDFTAAQTRALQDIVGDMGSGFRMNRLVQGDVGSGKTVVATAALLLAVDSGYQGVFMAPTEILAEQHFATLSRFFDPLQVTMRLLVGRQRKALRREILADIAAGTAQVVVGTHAVIEDNVVFNKLGLAVIDEQHRFGVMQRARLFKKGERTHVLLMTATPIPRSLALTMYGDLETSIIDELPAGRQAVRTILLFEKLRGEMIARVRNELSAGCQAYVVYPLVGDSDKMDLKDAESGFKTLQAEFSEFTVDLLHGQMPSHEKEAVMDRFTSGETDLLVATTVIEVGVDVPNASVMVIEHAERFGLSQLHQLRGRVGRGAAQSWCILMADYRRSKEAIRRLDIIVKTTDGFRISNEDLIIRGAGDFFGTRQSGLPEFKIADIAEDGDIVIRARNAAETLLSRDPQIRQADHQSVRDYYERFYVSQGEGLAVVG